MKLSRNKIFYSFFLSLLPYIIMFFALILYSFYFEHENFYYYLKYTLIILGIFIAIISYISIKYFLINKNIELEVIQDKLKVMNNNKTLVDHFKIDRIIKYATPPNAENRMLWFPWDRYYYYKVVSIDGKEFILTCFIESIEKLELIFKNNIILSKKFIPVF